MATSSRYGTWGYVLMQVSRISVWMPKRPGTAISLGCQSVPDYAAMRLMARLSRRGEEVAAARGTD